LAFVAMRAFTRKMYGRRALFASRQKNTAPRLPPMAPPNLDEPQQQLYDTIVDTRIKVIGREALFDERGALRGPWNPEVASPLLGRHLERLATAVRTENSLPDRVYEVAILAVGVAWRAQFEWYAHERIARKAGVASEAFPLLQANVDPRQLVGILRDDELAAYTFSRELALTKRVSDETYAATKAALGGNRAMADLALTVACYHGVSVLLNSFAVALPEGAERPFPE
jgi:4-carboxymuconolactone decarboxylase